MRGEDMTPPEIVQLIAWSKEYAESIPNPLTAIRL